MNSYDEEIRHNEAMAKAYRHHEALKKHYPETIADRIANPLEYINKEKEDEK